MLALSTGSLYTYGLERVFALAAEAGFDGVEVLIDERWDTRQPEILRSLEERYRLPIISLHSPFAWRMEGWEPDSLSRLRRTVELARLLDVSLVVVHLPFRWHEAVLASSLFPKRVYLPLFLGRREDGYARWLCRGLADYERETGVVIAVENMPCKQWGPWRLNPYCFNSLQEMAQFPHLTMDTTHLGTWGIDILAAYEQIKKRLMHIHLSNYNGDEHRLPWDGRLPLAELLQRLRRDGYAGHTVVELGPEPMGAGNDSQVKETLRAIVTFWQRFFV